MAAYGMPVGDMAGEDLAAITRVADTILTEVMSGPILAKIAAETPLDRIQSVIPQAQEVAHSYLAELASVFPRPTAPLTAVFTAYCALALIRIGDLGGGEALAELLGRASSASDSSVL